MEEKILYVVLLGVSCTVGIVLGILLSSAKRSSYLTVRL